MSEKATVFKKTPVPEIQPAPGRAMAPLRPQDWEHSASAECPSSPGGQRGTGPEKEPESSAGPLSQDGGLPPVTLQVRSAPCLPVLPASPEASLSPVLTSAVLLASLAACLSPVLPLPGRPQLCLPSLPALLPAGQGTGLGSHLAPTPHSHPRPRLQESLRCFWKTPTPRRHPWKPYPLAWPWARGCTPTAEAARRCRGLACCHCPAAARVSQACGAPGCPSSCITCPLLRPGEDSQHGG